MSYCEVINKLNDSDKVIAVALGGSRSRGCYKINSDYDLFCVINDNDFDNFRKNFRLFLEEIPGILYAAEAFYLENWGYLFKAIDYENTNYDISIISESRIDEMSIRSTNIVLKDTNGIYQRQIDCADDSRYLVGEMEKQHFMDYGTLFGFERARFFKAIEKEDYWYAVRCLERMKNYLIRCERIQSNSFPKSRSCPEKEYMDVGSCLKRIYLVDGSLDTLTHTSTELCDLFVAVIKDKDIQMRSQLR